MTQVSVANELLLTIPHGFEPSSRIKATLEGSYRSNGASCNFRKVRDDVEDILDATKWAGLISQGQGAPTMDFSDLRPAGSPVSTGGTASGVLSFALMFDSVVSGMRRPGKKNSVGVALLDIEHPEILDRVVDGQLVPGWLSKEADRQFKTVFRAVIINPDRWHLVSKERKDALAEAYNAYRVFICKTREVDDQVLFPNVCTEVRLPTKGTCVLGAMNLGGLHPEELPGAFRKSAGWLANYYDRVAVPNFRKRPDLFDVDNPQNRQVGLGVLGMANYLGYNGLTYREAAQEIRRALRGKPAHPAIAYLVEGYRAAAVMFKAGDFVRAFTVQPTASTAYRLKDIFGYNCAPEVQPPQAVRDSEGRPRYTLKSELKGDTDCVLPSAIETRDEVPYEVYRDFAEAYQELLNSTGLAHTLSHCFYGETFTLEDLEHFMGSSLESLYYRLDPTDLSKATQKHQTWDNAGDLEFEGDETPTEPLGSCSIDKGYCEACGM